MGIDSTRLERKVALVTGAESGIGAAQVVDEGLMTGRPWRKQPPAITQDRPVRLYAPGSYE